MLNKPFIMQTLFAAVLISSCTQEQPMQYTDEETTDETTTAPAKRRTFAWEAQLDSADSGSLALSANATAFSISLTDCASTHAAVVNETKAYLELYEFDRNCLAKLTTFTLNNNVYTPKAGALFDTWLTGDIATFEVVGANPVDELTVSIVSTITNPVTAAGTIHYQFSEITNAGTSTLGEAVVRESAALSVEGNASPNFSIKQVQLVNITANGNGEFRILLECNNAVVDTGTDILCDDVPLSSISMKLTEDTYTLEPDETDLQAIFASGAKHIDMATEAFLAGSVAPALPKGGFITANTGDTDVMVMTGTLPIVTHPHMLFVLKIDNEETYTYYYIDVTTITQSNDGP